MTLTSAAIVFGEKSMTIRPDPTFHASPKLVMQAPVETFAYTLPLSPDFSRPMHWLLSTSIHNPKSTERRIQF